MRVGGETFWSWLQDEATRQDTSVGHAEFARWAVGTEPWQWPRNAWKFYTLYQIVEYFGDRRRCLQLQNAYAAWLCSGAVEFTAGQRERYEP